MLIICYWVSYLLISTGPCDSFARSCRSIYAGGRNNKIRLHSSGANDNDKEQSDKLPSDSNKRTTRPPIIPFDFIREEIRSKPLKSNNTDIKGGGDRISSKDTTTASSEAKRPPIIPFDFVREEIAPKRLPLDDNSNQLLSGGKRSKTALYDDRPTGYDTPDDDDDIVGDTVAQYDDSNGSIDNIILKIFKDIYIGSPYDSRKKQQARYVITNITVISILIGAVFTATWYLFPGKFISFRGDADLSSRYTDTYKYIDPSDLLDNNGPSIYFNDGNIDDNDDAKITTKPTGEYLDSAVGLPAKEVTRFAPPVAKPNLAPGRAVDL